MTQDQPSRVLATSVDTRSRPIYETNTGLVSVRPKHIYIYQCWPVFRFLEEPWIWLLKFSKDRFQFSSGFFFPKIKTWFQFSRFILGAVLVLDLTVLVPILELQISKNSEKPSRSFFEIKKPQKIWKFWNIIQKT
jgi:hypothetical protein